VPQSRSGRFGGQKNLLSVLGFEPGPSSLTANAPRNRDAPTGVGQGASQYTERALQARFLNPTAQSEEDGLPGTGIRLPSHRYRSRCRSVNPIVHIHVTSRGIELHLHSGLRLQRRDVRTSAAHTVPVCACTQLIFLYGPLSVRVRMTAGGVSQ
jgi:hypothetical protein